MSRPKAMAFLVGRIAQLRIVRVETPNSGYSTMMQAQMSSQSMARKMAQLRPDVSRKDDIKNHVIWLSDLDNSKESVYGFLDHWVAWEQNFPIASIKGVLLALEKEQQWHRIVQVIKWLLSKGQGTTMGTYRQLIKALDMDNRAEEAHKFWVKRIGIDLHSVPGQLCKLMISIYCRNNMLESLIKLFKGLEAFDRKPPDKSVVLKVANAYELLGLFKEKERVLEKYNDLFIETGEGIPGKTKGSSKKKKKSEAVAENAVNVCEKYDWNDLADNGKLINLTVVELKCYLAAHGLAVAGKKEVLINRILTHMGK